MREYQNMKFSEQFTVPADVKTTWSHLTDLAWVAQCIPGMGVVQSAGEGVYAGEIQVKVGPMGLHLNGRATIRRDDSDHHATMRAEASDRRAGSGVRIDMQFSVEPDQPDGTKVTASADVAFIGKLAQLGQPIIKRKADDMLREFVQNLRQRLGQRRSYDSLSSDHSD